jgi:hypothetical protein
MQYSLLTVSLAISAVPVMGQTVSSEEAGLTVCLMNDAGVPPGLEKEVERRVGDLLEDAAIQIRWLHGGDPMRTAEECWACAHPEAMRVLIVHWMTTGKQALPGELGQAFLGEDGRGVIADVFLDRMEWLTSERDVSLAQLLAHVTAHELGHLLLGANAHSAAGLMQAQLNEGSLEKMAQGYFRFSREQDKKMNEKVRAAGEVPNERRSTAIWPERVVTRRRVNQAEAM